MIVSDFMLNNRNLLMKYGMEFRTIVGEPLNKYLHPMTGFDLPAFDDFIQTPDDISMCEHVESLYGKNAVKLIKKIAQIEDEEEEG